MKRLKSEAEKADSTKGTNLMKIDGMKNKICLMNDTSRRQEDNAPRRLRIKYFVKDVCVFGRKLKSKLKDLDVKNE